MDLFDKYLSDNLSQLERENFEIKLREDEAFLKDFERHKKAIRAIEFAAVKEKIQRIGKEAEHSRKLSLKLVISLAASVALLVGAYFFITENYTGPTNYEHIYASINFKDPGLPTLMGEAEDVHQLDDLMIAYKLNKYDEAMRTGRELLALNPGNDTIRFYVAMIHYETGEMAEAADILASLRDPATGIGQKAEWYLHMIDLKKGDISAAREGLERIASDKTHIFRMEAIDALDVLDLVVN